MKNKINELALNVCAAFLVVLATAWIAWPRRDLKKEVAVLPNYLREYMAESCMDEATRMLYWACRHGVDFADESRTSNAWGPDSPSHYCSKYVKRVKDEAAKKFKDLGL